jgi:hypothetical protein
MKAKSLLVFGPLLLLGVSMPEMLAELKISKFFTYAIMLTLVFCLQFVLWLFAGHQRDTRALKLLGFLIIGCGACAWLFFLFEGPRGVFHILNLALFGWFFMALKRGVLPVDQIDSHPDKREEREPQENR